MKPTYWSYNFYTYCNSYSFRTLNSFYYKEVSTNMNITGLSSPLLVYTNSIILFSPLNSGMVFPAATNY